MFYIILIQKHCNTHFTVTRKSQVKSLDHSYFWDERSCSNNIYGNLEV